MARQKRTATDDPRRDRVREIQKALNGMDRKQVMALVSGRDGDPGNEAAQAVAGFMLSAWLTVEQVNTDIKRRCERIRDEAEANLRRVADGYTADSLSSYAADLDDLRARQSAATDELKKLTYVLATILEENNWEVK